eukprot:CAMPEP_0204524658 /NCGR_PEP_ID=MMETSP0661-20131031/7490_1 /ASSEMBLY_ACC=CAM_ASM_000606 /TAXON_ID=109239 /ORGANISM="Alexandrium margalefi, Strain AMGDE01CS-322" /LENGTH=36 /DNA_ID= /DNA_START= /DNA_END= /DNA_ORIENTATION=
MALYSEFGHRPTKTSVKPPPLPGRREVLSKTAVDVE